MLDSNVINHYLQSGLRFLLKLQKESAAKIKGNSFYCNALSGNSTYNISINSDMTVSCNCQDYDGSGHIGDLSTETMEEIFSSDKSQSFRKMLSEGKLPILTCSRCVDLKATTKDKAKAFLNNYHTPNKGIMIENTINCNLNCVACSRTSVQKLRKKNSLSLEDVIKVSDILKKNRVESLAFFNLGEPFLSKNIKEELSIIRLANPNITIYASTNGVFIENDLKREAALFLNHIVFSIDGMSDLVLRKYQRNGSFDLAYKNMSELVRFRNEKGLKTPIIEWKYVLFNWNDKPAMIEQAIEYAKKAGVDILSFWPTRSPIYGLSFRYYFGKYFKKVGTESWKGREIIFNKK